MALGPVRLTFAPWSDSKAEPFVRYEQVTKSYGDVLAVGDVSLDIYKGEFFALLGPSGCGKTTLMRLLAGFEQSDAGRLIVDGQDVSGIPAHLRPVNMMFQSYALFPHMSVYDNIAFGLKQEHIRGRELVRRVEEMLALVKLDSFAGRKPHQLSGGQKQRVALARSLAKRPKVLLLDEPLAALDKKLRDETQYELMHLQSDLKLTFIIVTHDQEEAMMLANRIAIMDHGKIAQVSTPAEIYENPNSRHVAEFVGEVNILEGVVTSVRESFLTIESLNTGLVCLRAENHDAKPGDRISIALRPAKVRISLDPPEHIASNAVRGEVWDIGYLGDFSIYHVRTDNGFILKAAAANATRTVERQMTSGDKVWLSWSEEAGVLLKE